MSDILVTDRAYISIPDACVDDLTPPTFAGLDTLDVESRGQIRATWLAGTDTSNPVRYEIYIQASTNVGLFNTANIVAITPNLQYDIFTMPDGSFLVNGTTYHVGVRAIDALSNRDANIVSDSVISTGILTSIDVYESEGAFAINASNQLQGTLWCKKNQSLATSSNSTLGTASYQVYDKAGNAVVGLTQSGIVADANGQFKITAVSASSLSESLEHYVVKVDITVDSAIRSNYVPFIQKAPDYNIEGVFSLDSSADLQGTFWITANEAIKTSGLGTASYTIYDSAGNTVVGMTESGITADANGLFQITPVTSALNQELSLYAVKVTITVDGITRSDFLPIRGKVPSYECLGIFSINASNQFEATLWATADGEIRTGASLGTASYTVYDKNGTAVAGLSESGITADGNGRFQTTAVSATLLTDLTHYTVEIEIEVDGINRISYTGFTLLGT
jgi:hypothetical protein